MFSIKNSRLFFFVSSFAACAVMSMSTGCASGGFSLTRKLATFVNSTSNIFLRIILYILLAVVFVITEIVDIVVLNTVDFWSGKVSAGNYEFRNGDRNYLVKHEVLPGSNLKRSTIQIQDSTHKQIQEVVLAENSRGEIEAYVDGVLRANVHDISAIPVASIYGANGAHVEDRVLWSIMNPMFSAVAQK